MLKGIKNTRGAIDMAALIRVRSWQVFAGAVVLVWKVVENLIWPASAVSSFRFWASLGVDGLFAGYVVYRLVVARQGMRAHATASQKHFCTVAPLHLKAGETHSPDDQSSEVVTQNIMR